MILDLFFKLFLVKVAIKGEKGDFMKNLQKPLGKPYFCKVWDMLLEVKIVESAETSFRNTVAGRQSVKQSHLNLRFVSLVGVKLRF